MTILKYITLALFLLNLPSFGLISFGSGIGGALSMLLFGCVFFYFFLNEKIKPVLSFALLGLLYFLISGFNFTGVLEDFFKDAIRYFIFILMITALAKKTSETEFCVLLLIGALSMLINVLIFPNDYGRYSGFYVNPNTAGNVCLIGFALAFKLNNKKQRLIAQFLFVIAGIMTFSRYFILLFILVNLVSILSNKKNIIGLASGVIALIIILSTTSLQLNIERFGALKSIFTDDVDTETISKETRNETWAEYTDVILDNPMFGNGYKAMQGRESDTVGIKVGVHNSYLMVLGESGIIPFVLLIFIYLALFFRSIKHFDTNPEYVYLSIILLAYLLVSHKLYENYLVLFLSIWLYVRVNKKSSGNTVNIF